MNRIYSVLTLGLLSLSPSGDALAQTDNAALNEARARLACGLGTVVASRYLPGGALEVTCSRPPVETSATVLQGTGLASSTTIAGLITVVVLIALSGSSDSTTTSTTTTSTR